MFCCTPSCHSINNDRNSIYLYLITSTRHPVLLVSNRAVRDGAREHETNKHTKNILNSIILFLLSCGCISLFCKNSYFFHVYCCWKRAAKLKPVLVLSFYLVIPKAYTIARRFRQSLIAIFQSLCCIISVYATRLLDLHCFICNLFLYTAESLWWISLQCLKKHSYF